MVLVSLLGVVPVLVVVLVGAEAGTMVGSSGCVAAGAATSGMEVSLGSSSSVLERAWKRLTDSKAGRTGRGDGVAPLPEVGVPPRLLTLSQLSGEVLSRGEAVLVAPVPVAPGVPVPDGVPGRPPGADMTFGVTTGGMAVPDAVRAFSAREGEGPPPRPALPEASGRGDSVDAPDRLRGPGPRPPLVAGVARGWLRFDDMSARNRR